MSLEPELVDGILEVNDPAIAAITKTPIRDISAIKREYIEILPNVQMAALADTALIEFEQTGRGKYCEYQDSYVAGTFHMTDAAGGALAAGDASQVALMGGAATLFKQAAISVEGKDIESKTDPGIGSLILKMIEASDDYIRTTASGSLVYPDSGNGGIGGGVLDFSGIADATATATGANLKAALVSPLVKYNVNYNQGWVKKVARTGGGVSCSFFLPIKDLFGWARDTSRVFVGQPFKLSLTQQTVWSEVLTQFNDIANGNAAFAAGVKVVLDRISWFVPQVVPSSKTETEMLKLMAEGYESVDLFREWMVYRSNVQQQQDIQWLVRNVGRGRATRVIAAFQRNDQLRIHAGSNVGASKVGNGAVFDNAGLTKIHCKLDEQQFPEIEYSPNFATNKYAREYLDMLRAGCKDAASTACQVGSVISYGDYGTLYPFFCFDVSRKNDTIFSEITDASVRLNATITPGGVDRTLWCIVETERRIHYKGDGAGKSFVVKI